MLMKKKTGTAATEREVSSFKASIGHVTSMSGIWKANENRLPVLNEPAVSKQSIL